MSINIWIGSSPIKFEYVFVTSVFQVLLWYAGVIKVGEYDVMAVLHLSIVMVRERS